MSELITLFININYTLFILVPSFEKCSSLICRSLDLISRCLPFNDIGYNTFLLLLCFSSENEKKIASEFVLCFASERDYEMVEQLRL